MEDNKLVSQEAFDTFVKAVSNKIGFLENLITNTIIRQETLLKVMCAKGEAPTFDVFVEGLGKYDAFVTALKEVRSISKMSDRIEAAHKYNEANPNAFPLMSDDINVLEQATEAESISKANFEKSLLLPHTTLFENKTKDLLAKSE